MPIKLAVLKHSGDTSDKCKTVSELDPTTELADLEVKKTALPDECEAFHDSSAMTLSNTGVDPTVCLGSGDDSNHALAD